MSQVGTALTRRRRRRAEQQVADAPAAHGGHEGQHDDPEEIQIAADRGHRALGREDQGAEQIGAVDQPRIRQARTPRQGCGHSAA
jgi:hypothetical protein